MWILALFQSSIGFKKANNNSWHEPIGLANGSNYLAIERALHEYSNCANSPLDVVVVFVFVVLVTHYQPYLFYYQAANQ